jgi:hypothetical protein
VCPPSQTLSDTYETIDAEVWGTHLGNPETERESTMHALIEALIGILYLIRALIEYLDSNIVN